MPGPALVAQLPESEFSSIVAPILERRCVVCHSCYNAPCQLNAQSWEGLDRGGNKQPVYHPSRIFAMAPTRMFQDARSTEEWRRRFNFFPVIAHSAVVAESLLHHFVLQRREHPIGGDFTAEKSTVCPATLREADALFAGRPEAGMPYGFPPLSDAELRSVEHWLSEGAPPPPPPRDPPLATARDIATWERFLNADELRARLVARYIYEHLFLAHVHFTHGDHVENAHRDFYRLVRSRTDAPAPIDEIATARPFDDPAAARVYYRFVRLTEAIVQKTHVPFELSDAKLARFRSLFFTPDWSVSVLPSYEPDVATNPFIAFAAIPARARYQFLLDDSYYHVRAFIHGPVCKGQAALNVIDEQFVILFLAPKSDLSVTQPEYLLETAIDLRLPAEGGEGIEALYAKYKASQLRYLEKRRGLDRQFQTRGRTLDDIWDGDGTNTGAILTVFRHFDSASVSRGVLGGLPKTIWVMDYPIFERTYYNLVAGFNVFGSVVHQLSTRQYMDNLRVESEDGFLRFVPRAERARLRADWYRGPGVEKYLESIDPYFEMSVESRVPYRDPAHAKAEFLASIKRRLGARIVGSARAPSGDGVALRGLADVAAPFARAFPDSTLLRVGDSVYSILHDRSHLNISFIFLEDKYLAPEEDTLDIIEGEAGSYPNLFLEVPPAQLGAFVAQVKAIGPSGEGWRDLVSRFGVRRSAPDFWLHADWFAAHQLRADPIEGGVLDLSRYLND